MEVPLRIIPFLILIVSLAAGCVQGLRPRMRPKLPPCLRSIAPVTGPGYGCLSTTMIPTVTQGVARASQPRTGWKPRKDRGTYTIDQGDMIHSRDPDEWFHQHRDQALHPTRRRIADESKRSEKYHPRSRCRYGFRPCRRRVQERPIGVLGTPDRTAVIVTVVHTPSSTAPNSVSRL